MSYKIQPLSLLESCMSTLRRNHRYINMTALPIELADKLQKYISGQYTDLEPCKHVHCLIMPRNVAIDAFNTLAPINLCLPPYVTYIYNKNDSSNKLMRHISMDLKWHTYGSGDHILHPLATYLRVYAKKFNFDIKTLIIIPVSAVNPEFSKYCLEKNLCIYALLPMYCLYFN